MHPPRTPAETEAVLAAELRTVRPALLSPYAVELPGARAAVLTRLWRGLVHEPLPWVTSREPAGHDGLVLRLADGRRLHGPASDAYATAAAVREVELDGTAYRHPAALMTALGLPHGHAFAVELGHSVASLALSHANQPPMSSPFTSWGWEQRVVDGHPFHPNCRSRPGFSVAEQLAYAPEHRAEVELGLVAVPEGGCLVGGEWPYREAGRVLIPVHPWQALHALKDERAVGAGVAGESLAAHPLMSLRTLALPDGPHVKTALSARLTSSVRDISVYSIESAAAVSAFMEAMAGRLDGMLHITRTLGAVTANTPDLAAVLRESPDVYAEAGERVVPVAALASTVLPQSPAWLAEFEAGSRSPSGCGCSTWVWPWRRTARTCWWCSRPRAPRCGSSTATWPTSGSARRGWPATAFRSRIWRAVSSRTTSPSCAPSSSARSSRAHWRLRQVPRPRCERHCPRPYGICRAPRISWRCSKSRCPPRR